VWFVRVFALGERQPEKPSWTHRKGITWRAVSPVMEAGEWFSDTGAASREVISLTVRCAVGP